MKYRIYIVIVVFCSIQKSVISQTLSEYPVSFLSNSFNTFIPSHEIRNVDSCKINFSSYIRKNTGLFNDVYQTKTQIGFNAKKSSISLQFYSDHQGELIGRSRFYLNYNAHVSITKRVIAFAGLSGGIVKKSLGNEKTDVHGVATVFDASAVLGLFGKQWMLVFSANQIPQNKIMPIKFGVPLLRYYQLYGNVSKKLSPDFSVDAVLMSSFFVKQIPELIVGAQTTWRDSYSCGIELSNYNIANYFIDFRLRVLQKCSISMLFSYETNSNINNKFLTSFTIYNCGFIIKFK